MDNNLDQETIVVDAECYVKHAVTALFFGQQLVALMALVSDHGQQS